MNIITKNGLLYYEGEENCIPLPEADRVAREHGFVYAELFVQFLEKKT